MKKLSYFLGLVAMTVMMTMTSCSKVSDDVKKVCDAFEDMAVEIENVESEQDFRRVMMNMDKFEPEVDEATELTKDDKEALKESFMTLTKALTYKSLKLSNQDISDPMVEEGIKTLEERLDDLLADSETLGDFIKNLNSNKY